MDTVDKKEKMNMRDRVLAVMQGKLPDRLPFIDRIEIWYKGMQARGTMPQAYEGMSLNQVHKAVGIGRQKFSIPYALKLRGVDMRVLLDGEVIHQEIDPDVRYFPAQYPPDEIPRNRPGTSIVEYHTPRGSVSVSYMFAESMISLSGMEPYLTTHLIKDAADFRIIEYILERAEFVPLYEEFKAEEATVGTHGFLVPCIHRIPFQQALLEYLGEMELFQALYDNREALDRLIHVLDLQMEDIIARLAGADLPYIEFGDNLDGMMTNPNLFQEYCIPSIRSTLLCCINREKRQAATRTETSNRWWTSCRTPAWMYVNPSHPSRSPNCCLKKPGKSGATVRLSGAASPAICWKNGRIRQLSKRLWRTCWRLWAAVRSSSAWETWSWTTTASSGSNM